VFLRRLSIIFALVGAFACSGNSSPTQPAGSNLCSFSLPSGPFAIGADGGAVEIPLTTYAGCTWNSEAMDFLSRPSADSTGSGSRSFHVDAPKNVGGRRQGRFRIQGFVGVPSTRTYVDIVTIYSTIEQEPLVVPVPTSPSYLYYAAPYPSWGGVTRAIRDGVDGTLQVGSIGQSTVNIVVRPLGGGGASVLSVSLGAPRNQTLHVGSYEDALRLSTATNPGIDFSVGSSGCNQAFGRFTLQDVMFTGNGLNDVGRLRASFEVSCESRTAPVVVGEVWYVAR
jgi:hypothetical protein